MEGIPIPPDRYLRHAPTLVSILALMLLLAVSCLSAAGCLRRGDQGQGGPQEPEERILQVTVWTDRHEVFLEHPAIVANEPVAFLTHITDLDTLRPRESGPVSFLIDEGKEQRTFVVPSPSRPGIYRGELTFASAGRHRVVLRIPEGGMREGVTQEGVTQEGRIPEGGMREGDMQEGGTEEGGILEGVTQEGVTQEGGTPEGGDVFDVDLGEFTVFPAREAAAGAGPGSWSGPGSGPDAPEGIAFLKEQQWKVLLATEPVRRGLIVERIRVSGVVTSRPGDRASVTPPIPGILAAPPGGTLPAIGDAVESGQVLALIRPPSPDLAARAIEAGAEALRADLALERAEVLLERTRRLATESARSARDVEEAEFAVRQAGVARDAAVALRAAYEKAGGARAPGREGEGAFPFLALELAAPISGRIVRVTGVAGEMVSSERPAMTILDTRRVFIEARLPEARLGRLSRGLGASFEAPDAPGRLQPIQSEGGRVVFLGLEVDLETRTVPIIYEVENPDGRLLIGMALTLHVETERAEEALAVPASAIVDEETRSVCFVQIAGETFERRDLTLGITDGDRVQVLSGLDGGERVVTRGAYAVRLASVATSIPAHGHAH